MLDATVDAQAARQTGGEQARSVRRVPAHQAVISVASARPVDTGMSQLLSRAQAAKQHSNHGPDRFWQRVPREN